MNKKMLAQFDFRPGKKIFGRYEIVSKVGSGYEGEVYMILETSTGIERAAKFFFPKSVSEKRAAVRYAKKLHRLRHCDIVIQYHHQEIIRHRGFEVQCLISDFVEGDLLSQILAKSPGQRLPVYEAFHLFYAMVVGVEKIHSLGEYHGDLHTDNVFVRKYGTGFDIKLIDLFHHGDSKASNKQFDILNLIKIFYETLGGQKHYSKLPRSLKQIICGLKASIIQKKFRTVSKLRQEIENFSWDE